MPEIPIVPAGYPRRNNAITRAFGRTLMRVSGWRFEGVMPDVPKVIVAVAPHTSNWDFVVGVMALLALDIRIRFFGKHTLFTWPFGIFMRALGGIAVDRTSANGVVGGIVNAFNAADRMIFALAPEGTRALNKGFKTGFLHIAHGAKVPICLTYFDFANKVVCFGKIVETTGDTEADLADIVAYFRPVQAHKQKDWQRL